MNFKSKIFLSLFVSAMLLSFVYQFVEAKNNSANSKASVASLKSFYFQQDFDGGVFEGQKLAPAFGESNELKAWYVLNMARNENSKDAITIAEEMVQKSPDDVWSWFALAGAMNWDKEKGKDALEIIETAYKKAPDDSDVIWLRAEVLRRQDKIDDALTFIEANLSKVNNTAELLVSKGLIFYEQGDTNKRDEAKIKTALETFQAARQKDENCVNAYYVPAYLLFAEKNYADAYTLLKTAVKLAPTSLKIHGLYWQATTGAVVKSAQQRNQEIETDINAFLNARTPNVKTLDAVVRQYANLNLKPKKLEFEERILREFNLSAPAERILAARYREFASTNRQKFSDSKIRSQYISMLRDFTNRKQHFNKQTLSEAYQMLFVELKDDKNLSNKELLDIVKGMAYNDENNPKLSLIKGTQELLKRNVFLKEAEQILRYGLIVAQRRADANRENYKSQDDFNDYLNGILSSIQDMLGWVIFHQGRNAEAEKELLKAYELNNNDPAIAFHLSQLYETTNRFDKAEEFYIKGLGVDSEEKNPNVEAVKAYYARRNGTLEGFEKYQAKLMLSVNANRKVRILSERFKNPQQAKAFTLSALDGRQVSLSSLKGKIVVINFWGVWCGWCVKEMPEFQRLAEKYKGDSEVAILTINNDGSTVLVQEFMQENRYNFTVLMENGYNDRVGIRNYPLTWFLDKEGRIAYIKRSYTKELIEEFSLRIEDLKTSP